MREQPNGAPINPRFIGAGLKSRDEIVRISGQPVAAMEPNEARRLIVQTIMRAPGRKRTIEIEVRSPGAKEIRPITLRFVPPPPGTKPSYD